MKDGNSRSNLVIGLVLGTITGIALGLLLAPKTGRESREIAQRKSGQYARSLLRRFRRGGTTDEAAEVTSTYEEASG